MKQTIILTHIDGDTTEMDLVVPDENPIEQIEITAVWEEKEFEVQFEDDRTLN